MQPTDRAALGFMCKDIIDFGRLKWLESQGLKSHLVKYVPFSISPENNLLVAGTWQRRDIATSEVSFFLCCGSFLMFLKTDLQFLFRLKFNLNFILKKNSIYWELLIYYRREIIKKLLNWQILLEKSNHYQVYWYFSNWGISYWDQLNTQLDLKEWICCRMISHVYIYERGGFGLCLEWKIIFLT